MEAIVTGCHNCPLNDNDIYFEQCQHPQSPNMNEIGMHRVNETSPDWCPLKKEPITIKLNQ